MALIKSEDFLKGLQDVSGKSFCIVLNAQKYEYVVFEHFNGLILNQNKFLIIAIDVLSLQMLWVGLCRLYCGAAKRQQKNRTKCVRLIMGTQISGKIA